MCKCQDEFELLKIRVKYVSRLNNVTDFVRFGSCIGWYFSERKNKTIPVNRVNCQRDHQPKCYVHVMNEGDERKGENDAGLRLKHNDKLWFPLASFLEASVLIGNLVIR